MLSATGTDILASGVLIALGLILVMRFWSVKRGTPYNGGQFILYLLNTCLARLFWRAGVSRPLPVAPDRGAVIVSNHRSPVDPAFIQLASGRLVHWMVAREFCVMPVVSWFFRTCRCIPVGRGGIDTAAMKQAIRIAQQGGLVGLFPEGRINRSDRLLLRGRLGAAMIALKAGVPVIPCYVAGSPFDGVVWHSLFTPARVTFQVGDPIDPSEFPNLDDSRQAFSELSLRLMRDIAHLAGKPDFVPTLAGRAGRRSGAGPRGAEGSPVGSSQPR
ncbi:MAG: 1-acyl-sn-glycerol-3-phosphate acyltransferase [Planctomycetes bacterium]|nr:1-acyl-sn-glycerol-3-phosphate acyltransferase [Planctomycetota bacterium]